MEKSLALNSAKLLLCDLGIYTSIWNTLSKPQLNECQFGHIEELYILWGMAGGTVI